MNTRIPLFALVFGCALPLCAQQTVVPAGVEATGAAGTTSGTVGQVGYTAPESASGRVSQGVQQTYEVITVSTTEPMNPALVATVGPNPSADGVVLRLQGSPDPYTGYNLHDASGKLLRARGVVATETAIDLSDLAAGSYILSLVEGDLPILVVRIIKQ
jgi:hypothetical protein